MSSTSGIDKKDALEFLKFVDASPSPYHCVDVSAKQLEAAGYERISERESWKLQAGGKYYFTRNQSTIFAFDVGAKYVPGNGVHIIGAHTDSPNLRLKPVSKNTTHGFLQVGVQTYGGGLWHTWFDRDLSVAGRVVVKTAAGGYDHRLVRINRPIMRVPNLAIHLRTDRNTFAPDKEIHVRPVLCTEVARILNGGPDNQSGAVTETPTDPGTIGIMGRHHAPLLQLLAAELGVDVADIEDFDLSLFDTQPSTLGGLYEEFVFAPRLDNQMSCFTGMKGLLAASDLTELSNVRILAMFDHEEIGSTSAQGAASNMMQQVVERIVGSLAGADAPADIREQTWTRSFLISADMAHALHPNYSAQHETQHRPAFHSGPVIKTNANQRYATNDVTGFLIRKLAEKASVPIQEFVVTNSSPCGSTIGPVLSARCGMRTVDIGIPQLSMHSIREMCATSDVTHAIKLFEAFFSKFTALEETVKVD